MPKETGIVMSGSHPKLILDGLKTMTRRTWGLEKINKDPDAWMLVAVFQDGKARFCKHDGSQELTIKCPYGGYSDLLWVKETWASENRYNHLKPSEIPQTAKIFYLADGGYSPFEIGKVRSPLFMPRWASRITREITELRAERLQEITDKDARAEGVEFINKLGYAAWRNYIGGENEPLDSPIASFQTLWDSLNAKRGYPWAKNNWVWPIRFRMIKQ